MLEHTPGLDNLFASIMQLESVEECYNFFEDICTIKEITDMAQRLEAAVLLNGGANYKEIGEKTGLSTATISRVSKCLHYGAGGYKNALKKMNDGEKE